MGAYLSLVLINLAVFLEDVYVNKRFNFDSSTALYSALFIGVMDILFGDRKKST